MSRRDAGRRPAVTLLEVLVVLAITGVLIALAAGAVQRVRAAAARAACSNQLRQLALGLHSFASQHGAFPPGVGGEGGRDPYPFLGFHARLLPHLEQQDRWRQIEAAYRANGNFLADPPHTNLSTAMPQFGCPLDERTRTPQLVSGRHLRGLTSYLGVEGTNSSRQDGVLFLDSRVRPQHVTDGLSQTLLLGERPPSPDFIFGWWYAGWGQDKDGEAEMVLGTRTKNNRAWAPGCPVGPYSFGPGDPKNKCDTFHFWSFHPGGAHFAFADGGVRFLRYDAADVLPALATRAGGEAASPPE